MVSKEEAELIKQDYFGGMQYKALAKKYHKSFRDLGVVLKTEGEEEPKDEKEKKRVILPTVATPKVPVSEWRPTQPRSVDWIFIGPLHVQVDVINLYNYWREEIDSDTTLDEFISFCVKQFFSVGRITPVIVTGFGGQNAEIESRGDLEQDGLMLSRRQ